MTLQTVHIQIVRYAYQYLIEAIAKMQGRLLQMRMRHEEFGNDAITDDDAMMPTSPLLTDKGGERLAARIANSVKRIHELTEEAKELKALLDADNAASMQKMVQYVASDGRTSQPKMGKRGASLANSTKRVG